MVAFRAAAWDLDALRGAHGGGRSVRPGRLSAARPRAPPAPRLRVALGTWHSQPPEPGRTARREMVSGQPGRCDAADSAPFRKPAGTAREREAGGGGGPEGEELRLRARRLATGPRSGQDSSRRGVYRPGRKGPWLQRLLVARVRKGREQMPSALGSWFILGLV